VAEDPSWSSCAGSTARSCGQSSTIRRQSRPSIRTGWLSARPPRPTARTMRRRHGRSQTSNASPYVEDDFGRIVEAGIGVGALGRKCPSCYARSVDALGHDNFRKKFSVAGSASAGSTKLVA
jgi:hypothetical protein